MKKEIQIAGMIYALLTGGSLDGPLEAEQFSEQAFLKDRPLPLRQIETTAVIDVADFGAKPDTGENMLPALRAAVTAAIDRNKPVTVKFLPGEYRLNADEELTACFTFRNVENIVMDGNGAELIIQNPRMSGFLVENSRRIIIKNFSVDYDPLPYAQAWVTAVDSAARTFEVRLDEGSSEMDLPYFRKALRKWGTLYDRDNPLLAKGDDCWIVLRDWEKNGERQYKISHLRGSPEVGDAYLQVARENGCKTVMLRNAIDVTLENLTTYACPSSPYTGNSCSNIGIFSCKVLVKPGRWIGSNADAVHFQRNAVGPWVENCQFEGVCDDAVNIYAVPNVITAQPSADSLTVKALMPATVTEAAIGATVWVFDPVKGALISEAVVKEIQIGGKENTVILDREIPRLTLKPEEEYGEPLVYFSHNLSSQTVFKNNQIRHPRRFGLVLPTQGVWVEGNLFEDCGASAIIASNHIRVREEIDMFTGGNLVIRNNTIRNGERWCQSELMNQYGSINLSVLRNNHQPAEWRALDNVLVENNTIENWRTCGIRIVNGGTNVTVRGNRISSDASGPLLPGVPHAGILIENSEPVVLENNIVTDSRPVEETIIR